MEDEIQNVVEETTENTVEQPAEEVVEGAELSNAAEAEETTAEETKEDNKGRYMTEEDINKLVDRRVARKMSKLEEDYDRRMADYNDTKAILEAGLGTSDIKEANQKLREFYRGEGYEVPDYKPTYTKRENKILAEAEANEFIEDGYDAMLNEANKLAAKGYDNMDEREKIIFTKLGEKLTAENDKKALRQLGAKEDLINDENFKEFRNQFKSNTPMEKIYALYKGIQPKTKVENPGSMKNTPTKEAKDRYTDEEIANLTLDDLDKPGVFEAVRKSMTSNN